jgi:hypothetical protein
LLDGLNEDWRQKLSLAHYSLQLSSIFVLEYSFAHIVHNHFIAKKSQTPFKINELFEVGKKFADIFSSEHLIDYNFSTEVF